MMTPVGTQSYVYLITFFLLRAHLFGFRGAQVKVLDSSGTVRQVTILGIDEFGFLKVREASGKVFTVHPDGNSFDMMEGLIAPKLK